MLSNKHGGSILSLFRIPSSSRSCCFKTTYSSTRSRPLHLRLEAHQPILCTAARSLYTSSKTRDRKTSPPKTAIKFAREDTQEAEGEDKLEAREPWRVKKAALARKFGEAGWQPLKKLSPDALDGIRALHKQQPDVYTTEVLANEFEISAEAIRRILKSNWRPTEDVAADRRRRWEKRGEAIWAKKAVDGIKPPKKWRTALGIKLKPRPGAGSRGQRRPGLGRDFVAQRAVDDIPLEGAHQT